MLDINKDIHLGVHVSVGVKHVMQALTLLVQAGRLRPSYLGVSPSGCIVKGMLRVLFCLVPNTVTIALKLKTRLAAKTDFELPRDASWLAERVLPTRGEMLTQVCGKFLVPMLIRWMLFVVPVVFAVLGWTWINNP